MPTERYPIGNAVACDFCGADYTDSAERGGFLFDMRACCPQCAPRIEQRAKEYDEAKYIRHRCPSNMTFANFVRSWRTSDEVVIES